MGDPDVVTRAWVGLLTALSTCLVSCASTTPPPSILASGPCSLVVFAEEEGDPSSTRPLAWPYVIDSQDEALVVKGSAWRDAEATVTEPSGATHIDPISLNETNAWPIDMPGVWRFRFEDDAAGCIRVFSVEVRL
jgi:hypothetical protein